MKNKLAMLIIGISSVFVLSLTFLLVKFNYKEEFPESSHFVENSIVLGESDMIDLKAEETGAKEAELSEKGGMIYVASGATFTLKSGSTLLGNQDSELRVGKEKYGGAVYVANGGTFIMEEGATISGCNAKYGGAIYVELGGKCYIQGGSIENCSAERGGYAVYAEVQNTKTMNVVSAEDVEENVQIAEGVIKDSNVFGIYDRIVSYVVDDVERGSIDLYDEEIDAEGNYIFDDSVTSLTYENCMGWFQEDYYMSPIDYKESLVLDKYGDATVYTKKATLDKLRFTLNSTVNKYSVKAKDSSITGEVVIPREYNGKDVYEIANDGFTILTDSTYSTLPITSAYIPATIKTIGEDAFSYASSLTFINLPEGLEKISYMSFLRCYSLTEIKIPSTVMEFVEAAFNWCYNLSSITVDSDNTKYQSAVNGVEYNVVIDTESRVLLAGCKNSIIPNDVQEIGRNAFYGHTQLKQANIPSTVSLINYGAFCYCRTLETITVDKENPNYTSRDSSGSEISSVIEISSNKFVQGSINSTIPATVVTIGEYAFAGINITEATIPSSVSAINRRAFMGCYQLEKVTIPNSVISIEEYAFNGCSGIKTLDFGANITTLNTDIFSSCTAIETLTVSGALESVSKDLFGGCKNLVTLNVSVPLADSAFKSCTKLQHLTIGKNVITIPQSAFNDCLALNSIDLSNSSIQTVGNYAFYSCLRLTDINFNGCSSLTTIENTAFNSCPSLKTITSSDFSGCTKLSKITIPSSITSIEASAFKDCTALSTLNYLAGTTTLDASVFANCKNITTLTISGSLTNASKGLFGGCDNLTTLDVSTQLYGATTNISEEQGAFYGCSKLSRLTISGKTTIEDYAFSNCTGLNTLNLSALKTKLQTVGTGAFKGCTGLTSLSFADFTSLKYLWISAFEGCTSLATVSLSGCTNMYSVGQKSFKGCSSLTSVNLFSVGSTVAETTDIYIDDYAFQDCTSLSSVTLSTSLKTIDLGAFSGCKAINKLSIPSSVTSIDMTAFSGCSGITELTINGRDDKDDNPPSYANKDYFDNLPSLTTLTLKCSAPSVVGNDTNGNGTLEADEIVKGKSSFSGIETLTTVKIGAWYDGGTTIGDFAFAFCDNLQSVEIHHTSSIGAGAFMLYAEDDDDLTQIGNKTEFNIFADSGIESLKTIGEFAFFNRKNLKDFNLLEHPIEEILKGAFMNTGLINDAGDSYDLTLSINSTIKTIGQYAFCGCTNLTYIDLSTATQLKVIDEFTFANTGLASFIVPNCVDNVYPFAFANCTNLKRINIPDEVDKVHSSTIDEVGDLEDYAEEGLIGGTSGVVLGIMGALALHCGKVGATVGGVVGAAVGVAVGVFTGWIISNTVRYSPFLGCENLYIHIKNKAQDDRYEWGWTYWGGGATDCHSFADELPFNGHLITDL